MDSSRRNTSSLVLAAACGGGSCLCSTWIKGGNAMQPCTRMVIPNANNRNRFFGLIGAADEMMITAWTNGLQEHSFEEEEKIGTWR